MEIVQFHFIIELIPNDFDLKSWTMQFTFGLQAKNYTQFRFQVLLIDEILV